MSGYIGTNNIGIDISYNITPLSGNNIWNYFTQFAQLSTSCIDISSSTIITNIPNNIIIFGGNLTITYQTIIDSASTITYISTNVPNCILANGLNMESSYEWCAKWIHSKFSSQ